MQFVLKGGFYTFQVFVNLIFPKFFVLNVFSFVHVFPSGLNILIFYADHNLSIFFLIGQVLFPKFLNLVLQAFITL